MVTLFSTELAGEVGDRESVMLINIAYWVKHNEANKSNEHDGHFWTYNSIDGFCNLFPCWSVRQIRVILKNLEEKDCIVSRDDLNANPYDHTKWYTLTEKGQELTQWIAGKKCHSDLSNLTNRIVTGDKSTIKTKNNQSSSTAAEFVDTDMAEINALYESCTNTYITPFLANEFAEFKDEYSKEWVVHAIRHAARMGTGKVNAKYIEATLKGWRASGMARPWEYSKQAQQAKDPFDWGGFEETSYI